MNRYTADFGLLDVKRGRATLRNLVKDHRKKIPVTVTGFLTNDWSGDDGTSIEFEIDITKVEYGEPVAQECRCIRCMTRAKAASERALKRRA